MLEVSGIANKEKNLFINEQIRAKEVMVIGPHGEQLGVKPIKDALNSLFNINPLLLLRPVSILLHFRFLHQQVL